LGKKNDLLKPEDLKKLDVGLKAGTLRPNMFEGASQAVVQAIVPQIAAFRGSPDFEAWLLESEAKTPTKLRQDWWIANKHSKWAHIGDKCTNLTFQAYVEFPGNAVVNKTDLLSRDPLTLEDSIVRVFWPADNLTRVCRLMKWQKAKKVFSAFYYFDDMDIEEDLTTDWEPFPVRVGCGGCGAKVGPTKYCSECGEKLVLTIS